MESKQKFLSFNLGERDAAVISLEKITEVLPVSLSEICSVPQMPNCVMGIYNWRGEMLWLIDLEDMLGYPSIAREINMLSKLMTIIIRHESKSLGLLVRKLTDIDVLDINQMKSPESKLFKPEIFPVLNGYFINQSEEIIVNLNTEEIIHSPMWSTHA
ncbi:MAG: chemotaxis protein CheW [Cyanobacteria bacterium P01_A01_bin.84]